MRLVGESPRRNRSMPHGTPPRPKGPSRFEHDSGSLFDLPKMFLAERAARRQLEKSV